MATKQELEAQVAALTAEVESLKSAQPVDVQVLTRENEALKAELVNADVQASLLKDMAKQELETAKAETQKLRLELISAIGESQALAEKLAAKPVAAGIDMSEADPAVSNVRDLKEQIRRGHTHDEQRVILLKG